MTYESSQRCAEGRASKPCSRSSAEVRPTAGGSRAIGGRLCDLPATGLSVPTTGSAAEEAGPNERREVGVHREAVTKFDSTSAVVRKGEGVVDQRSGQSGLARIATWRAKAWVRRTPRWILVVEYRFDRLLAEKLAQVYQVLVPDKRWATGRVVPASATPSLEVRDEQDSRHLRTSLFRPTEGESHDRQSDSGAKRVRRAKRI